MTGGVRMIDHVAEAMALRQEASESAFLEGASLRLEAAQVHATLALAEQQKRIADVLESWSAGGGSSLAMWRVDK